MRVIATSIVTGTVTVVLVSMKIMIVAIFTGYMNAPQSGVALSPKSLPLKQTNLWPILERMNFDAVVLV